MSLTNPRYSLHSSQCSKCTDRTMESVYIIIRSAHPQWAAGKHFVSETDVGGRMRWLWSLTATVAYT